MMALDALVDPWPGPGPLSTTATRSPVRASSSAIDEPMTPAPITTASAVTTIGPLPSGCWLAPPPSCRLRRGRSRPTRSSGPAAARSQGRETTRTTYSSTDEPRRKRKTSAIEVVPSNQVPALYRCVGWTLLGSTRALKDFRRLRISSPSSRVRCCSGLAEPRLEISTRQDDNLSIDLGFDRGRRHVAPDHDNRFDVGGDALRSQNETCPPRRGNCTLRVPRSKWRHPLDRRCHLESSAKTPEGPTTMWSTSPPATSTLSIQSKMSSLRRAPLQDLPRVVLAIDPRQLVDRPGLHVEEPARSSRPPAATVTPWISAESRSRPSNSAWTHGRTSDE